MFFDVAVIGAGMAGLSAAKDLSGYTDRSSMSITFHVTDVLKPASRVGSVSVVISDRDRPASQAFLPHAMNEISAFLCLRQPNVFTTSTS